MQYIVYFENKILINWSIILQSVNRGKFHVIYIDYVTDILYNMNNYFFIILVKVILILHISYNAQMEKNFIASVFGVQADFSLILH